MEPGRGVMGYRPSRVKKVYDDGEEMALEWLYAGKRLEIGEGFFVRG